MLGEEVVAGHALHALEFPARQELDHDDGVNADVVEFALSLDELMPFRQVALVNRTAKESQIVELKGLAKDKWAEVIVDFSEAKPQKPKTGDKVDEIHFLLPKGGELLIDDLLLYEPGGK
jgi:hypothetical protein